MAKLINLTDYFQKQQIANSVHRQIKEAAKNRLKTADMLLNYSRLCGKDEEDDARKS